MRELRNYVLVGFLVLVPYLAGTPQSRWVATWASSPEAGNPSDKSPLVHIENQTVRERVRVSLGGDKICLRFSNEHGSSPLLIGGVTVAVPQDFASVKPSSLRSVTFAGSNSVTIPPGAPVFSDPVAFPVAWGAEISVSVYFPQRVATPTLHWLALKRAVVSQPGDYTREEKIEGAVTDSSIALTAVLVPAHPSQRLLVAFGDSLTDGDQSTVDADHDWPSDLVRRLAKTDPKLAVVNEGIAGNRLLAEGPLAFFGVSAWARFNRDALSVPGVTHIVLLEGINDISFPGTKVGSLSLADPSAVRHPEDLIAAYRQLIFRAHAHGIKVIGGTIPPCEGAGFPGYYSEAKDAIRRTVNKWIRTAGAFDAVIDFDAILRDPGHPSRLLPRFASPDHLHPNDAGYQAMANAVDLTLFK